MNFGGDGFNWIRLTNLREDYSLTCGSVFRFPSQYPYEEYVDYMLCSPSHPEGGFFFVVMTGYKAGWIYDIDAAVKFDSEAGESVISESGDLYAGWVEKNWKKYCYIDCEPEEVYYVSRFPVPEYPIHLALRSKLGNDQYFGRK